MNNTNLPTDRKHQIKFFINKFEATKEEEWCVGSMHQGDKHCGLGHLNAIMYCVSEMNPPEANAFLELDLPAGFNSLCIPHWQINDGKHPDYQQPTPRQRILAALYDLLKQ